MCPPPNMLWVAGVVGRLTVKAIAVRSVASYAHSCADQAQQGQTGRAHGHASGAQAQQVRLAGFASTKDPLP